MRRDAVFSTSRFVTGLHIAMNLDLPSMFEVCEITGKISNVPELSTYILKSSDHTAMSYGDTGGG